MFPLTWIAVSPLISLQLVAAKSEMFHHRFTTSSNFGTPRMSHDHWSQWHEAAAIASRLRKSNTPKDSTPMGNNSHRSDPGNSQVESTDDKWEKLQNSSAGLKNPGKCFGKARRHRFCKLHGVFDDHTRRRIFQELCMLQQLGIPGLEVCPLGALARSFWRNYCRNKNPRGQHNGKDGKLKIFCNDNLSHCLAI